MPTPLPYVPSYGKIKPLFDKITSAKVPDAFTQKYLSETLGLTSKGDRPLIPLLRSLEFIDAAGRPTASYASLKNPQRAGEAIAKATKAAYAALFAANEKVHTLSNDELKGLVAQVAGTDENLTVRTAGTFKALVGLADQKAFVDGDSGEDLAEDDERADGGQEDEVEEKRIENASQKRGSQKQGNIRPEFHYNIQIHLPSSGTEETYLNIFNALRKAL